MKSSEDVKEHRRQVRIGRRRAEILEAAKALFLARDYTSVSIDEIANAAAFSRATVYTYFATKQDIYLAIVSNDLDTLVDGMTQAFDEMRSLRENLTRMVQAYMAYFIDHPEYFTTMSFFFLPGRREGIPPEAKNRVDARLAEGIASIRIAIELAIARGEARHIDAQAATLSLWGQWMGIAYLSVADRFPPYGRSLEQVYMEGLDVFLEGLVAVKSAAPEEKGKA